MKRIIVSLLIAAAVPALFWLAGFDFDERGSIALWCALLTTFSGIFAYTCPAWEE